VQELRNTQVTWLTGVLGALMPARKKGTSVASLAAYVFSVCQGALLSARMTGRVDDFDEAVAQLRSSLPG
jgi:TetR/AcrR family transcriptional repressor of nem operon